MAYALGVQYWLVPQATSRYYGRFSLNADSVAAIIRVLTHVLHDTGLADLLQRRDGGDL